MSMSDTAFEKRFYPRPTNIDEIAAVISQFQDSELFELFARGAGMGADNMWYADEHFDTTRSKVSPLSGVVEAPAWEGSHRGRMLEHDLVFSLGAVVGAFATRAGVDIAELLEQTRTERQSHE